ncbi:MAG: hypothetical protein P8J87_11410 [Verrucomicrobiales bacterium]|nr:hypothetical protein [Verrucomicrobiales bacterium]
MHTKQPEILKNLVLASIVCLLVVACGQSEWKTTDDVEIISESKSPDAKYIATVFSCSGGGAAGYSYTNVNLRKTSDEFSQRDFLLGKHLWNSYNEISVDWKDSTNLDVSYHWLSSNPEERKQNGRRVAEKDGVVVNYIQLETE